jgi:hypothetical protein
VIETVARGLVTDEECPGERYRTSKETRRSSLSP